MEKPGFLKIYHFPQNDGEKPGFFNPWGQDQKKSAIALPISPKIMPQ
jgi:hypothetical protein